MGPLPFHVAPGVVWSCLASVALLLFLLGRFGRERADRAKKNPELQWFSDLHLFGRALAESSDPKQMAGLTVRRASEMLKSSCSYAFIQMGGSDAACPACSQGLAAATVERLSSEPLRSYLASGGERWGNLLVFPDLALSSLGVAWQRDERFQQLRTALTLEGLKALVLVDLRVRQNFYGVLLIGCRKARVFHQKELRLALAIGNQLSVALENWTLHRAAERRNEELRILHQVSESLRTAFDLKSQMETLRRELAGVLGAVNFALALQDSPDGPLETAVPFAGDPAGDTPEAAEDGLAEFVRQSHRPLLLNEDLSGAARRLGISSLDDRLRTWCGVPLYFSDGAMGVLAAGDFSREHAISQEQFELLQVIADEATGAIEHARLFQKERRRSSHLALLNELGKKAASFLDPKELLSSICAQVRTAFDRDLVRIEVADPQGEALVIEAEAGYGKELLGRRIGRDEGLSGAAARGNAPVVANSVLRDPRYVALHPGVRSALSLPMRYQDRLLGVLSLESLREHCFFQEEALTLQTLADQIAIALHNARAYQVALEHSITDGLTGLKTHRYFREMLDAEWRRSTRARRRFSLIMMDLDGFKRVNDQHGHLEGDKVLVAVARLLDSRSRQSNVAARYGGDEFAILLPEATTEQAEILAERLRAAVGADEFLHAHGATASFGIATFPDHGPTQEEILRFADSGMYLAKHYNGNCVKTASLMPKNGDSDRNQRLLEAYLGVAVKRMFSTGPDAFSRYLQRFEQMMQGDGSESPSLMDTITALAFAIEAKDPYTQGHSQAVSRLAAQIAMQVQLPEAEVEEIRLAGMLHDIGKIGVPESVLNKPAVLTAEEYEVIKSHATLGAKILEPLKVKAIEGIRCIVLHHHEAFGGHGYPDNLKGEQIPLGARIVTVADAFDTMVSARAYKKVRAVEDALAELRHCQGTQFDPSVVDAFVLSLESVGGYRSPDSAKNLMH